MTGIGNKRQEGVAPRDALGWAIAPGDVVVYPVGADPVRLRLAVVTSCGSYEEAQWRGETVERPRVQVLGFREVRRLKDGRAWTMDRDAWEDVWETYRATLTEVQRLVIVHPDHYDERCEFLRREWHDLCEKMAQEEQGDA